MLVATIDNQEEDKTKEYHQSDISEERKKVYSKVMEGDRQVVKRFTHFLIFLGGKHKSTYRPSLIVIVLSSVKEGSNVKDSFPCFLSYMMPA